MGHPNPQRGGLDPRIVAAIEHVAGDLAGPITVAGLARVAHLSTSRFSHLFRAQVGLAPRAFVEQQRLDRARHLLELTTLPVHAVAEQVGFASQFHFATRFRRRVGTTPSAYRAAARNARTQSDGTGAARRSPGAQPVPPPELDVTQGQGATTS